MRISSHTLVLLGCIVAQAALTLCYAITLHFEFKTSGVDGMVYEQLMRNIIDGKGFVSSINFPFTPQPWLGFHFSPVLYLLVPFYDAFPHFQTLLAIGSVCVALAAWPIYLTARTILRDSFQALMVALLYLINPFVVNGVLWDFHEVDLAPLCIAWMLWAVVHRKARMLVALSVALMCIKEHYGLSVAGFGLLWAWHWREWKFGLSLSGFGVAVLCVVIVFVMPHFNPAGKPAMMNAASPMDRFGWLTHAGSIREHAVPMVKGMGVYGALLLLPFLMLPVGAFAWLLPGMADAAANSLSLLESMRSVDTYYSMALMPVILIACCQCLRKYFTGTSRFSVNDMLLPMVVAAAGFGYVEMALPFSDTGNIWEFSQARFHYDAEDQKALESISRIVPAEAPLAAQMNILPHFTPRYGMTPFPGSIDAAEYVVLRLKFPFAHAVRVFGSPYGGPGSEFMNAAESLLRDKSWGVVYYADRWVVLQKGVKGKPEQAEAALRELRKEYQGVLEAMQRSYAP